MKGGSKNDRVIHLEFTIYMFGTDACQKWKYFQDGRRIETSDNQDI